MFSFPLTSNLTPLKNEIHFRSLVEAYRENGKITHRTIRSFGLLTEEQLPYLKAMYAKKKPRLVYDDEH